MDAILLYSYSVSHCDEIIIGKYTLLFKKNFLSSKKRNFSAIRAGILYTLTTFIKKSLGVRG